MAINDVVRHVILRILVDQAGLAEELAAAREKLKALKKSEGEINRERGKSADEVTGKLREQNRVLDENSRAHEGNRRARTTGQNAAQQVDAETSAIKENTRATEAQTVAEAKAEAIRRKARQDELNEQQKRRERRRQDEDAAAQDAARAEQKLTDAARKAYQQREQAAEAHEQKIANTQARNQQGRGQSNELHEQRLANQQRVAEDKAAESAQRLANIREAGEIQAAKAADARERAEAAAARRAEVDAERLAGVQQINAVKEVGAAQKVEQAERAAAQKREQQAASFEQNQANRQRDADRRDQQSTEQFLANEARKQAAADETSRRKDEESAARVETSNARTQEVVNRSTDAQQIRDNTRVERESAVRDRATSQSQVAQSQASAAASREEVAATNAVTAEERRITAETTRQNRNLAEQETLNQRRIATTRAARVLEEDLTKAKKQGQLLDERIAAAAEARARAAEREATARRRQQTVLGSIGNVVADVAVGGIRASSTAFRGGTRRAASTARDPNSLEEIERKATTVTGRVEKLFGDLGRRISRSVGEGAEDAATKLGRLTQRVRGYIDSINRPRQGGSGNSLFSDLLGNLTSLGNKLSSVLSAGTSHLISFQSLVIAVIAALGPLAAILGAVGAAALALASDIGALAGAFFALPGLIGAAVSGFGALAIVMKPLSNLFSAYSAAQKEAVTNTNAAKEALDDYKIAQINAQQAQVDWRRAQQDAPRAELALKDARKDATRQLEDYTTALKKLRFEQEGANLDVLSAQQQARRAMADPTANNLDRQIALHNVQGALFDQQDQATNARRTRQDAAEAFKKGVEGSDAVIAANREVEDSARKIDLAYLQWQKDIIATNKAALEAKAGGAAAAAYRAQLAKLPPETRKVALAIFDLIKPGGPFAKMRNDLSEDIFGPISKDTGKFKDIVGELRSFLEPAAVAIGKLAKAALDLFTNPEWKDFFARQGEKNGEIIAKLGQAALDAANGFKAIVEIARPFTDFVVEGLAGMAKSFEAFATGDTGRKELIEFLQTTRVRMTELAPVVKNIASGIAGFFLALNKPTGGQEDFTTYFNKGLLRASATFKRLGQEAQDPNGGFQKWLRDVRPLLHDVVTFISAAAGFAGKLFSDNRNIDEARKILQEISGTWLPQLAEIFGKLSQSGLISKLGAAIGSIFTALNNFFDHGGLSTISTFATALEIAGQGLASISGWIGKLLEAVPALNGVAKVLGGTLALVFGAALIAKISGVIGLVSNLIKLVGGSRNVLKSIRDPDPETDTGKGRFTRFRQNATDAIKDRILPRDRGESAARRRTRERFQQDNPTGTQPGSRGTSARPGDNRPITPQIDRTGTGGVLPHLSRMEVLLQRIAANTARYGGGGGGGGRDSGTGGGRPRPTRPTGGSGIGGRPTGIEYDPNNPYTRPSNRRSRTTEWPERPASILDPVPMGRDAVPEGVDPNSREGRAYRKAAVERNRDSRTVIEGSGGRTPIGLNERTAERRISEISRSSRGGRLGRFFGALGRGAGVLAGLPAELPITEPEVPLGPDPATVVGRQPQPRDERGRFLPRPGGPATPAPRPAQGPQPRDERGRFLPRPPVVEPEPTVSRAGRFRSRAGRVGRGILGGLGSAARFVASPFTSRDDTGAVGAGTLSRSRGIAEQDREYEQGYDRGYEDGLSQLGGGQQSLPERDRRQRGRRGSAEEPEEATRGRAGQAARRGITAVEDEVEQAATGGRGRGGLLSRLFNRGGRNAAARVAEEGVEDVAKVGGRGLLRGAAGGLLRGAAGGIGGLVAGAAASLGGDYLINKFVKNDKDAGSLQRGLGAVANGAGIGATIGSFIPGVGTVIGGAVGGLAGGAYSLFKDKNLRNFVGGKISGAAKSVGNFFGDLFDGGDDKDGKPGGIKGFLGNVGKTATSGLGGALAVATGPLGLLASQTDIGKAIVTSLNKAGGAIGRFFTKTIPDWFHKGTKAITDFFTKTLPSLPGKFFDAFFYSIGRMIRFFLHDLPAAANWLFTKAIPQAASAAWGFIVHDLWNPFVGFIKAIPGFFTQTIPHWFDTVQKWVYIHIDKPLHDFVFTTIPNFFTKTIPQWFAEAPHWFKTHVVDVVSDFFTVTVPNFFKVTLPQAIADLPSFLYNNLVQPILNFFGGLKDHVEDFLKGKWEWAKSLFTRASNDVQRGEQGKMSGGLITGVYQGIEDTARLRATPGEFVMRRSKAQEPGALAILTDWNEGRLNVADFYKGLSANTAPAVMAMVPPEASQLTSRVSTVSNTTVNHAPLMGDVNIYNPKPQPAEHSLRRQIQIAAIRHRR